METGFANGEVLKTSCDSGAGAVSAEIVFFAESGFLKARDGDRRGR